MTVITKKYYDSSECIWIEEKNTDGSENEKFEPCIKGKLKSALQMPNIMVLAGSGTSLGDVVNGPRMWDLWEACTTNDMLTIANECFSESGFDSGLESNQNIEICLSHCEAYLQVGASINKTTLFIKKCKELILEKCRFIKDKNAQLVGHKEFGGVLKSMLTLNEAIIDVKEG